MQKLEAVNIILRALGEHPVAALDVQYPTLNTVIPALDEAVTTVLSEGWWFNTRYRITLPIDVDGVTVVPDNTLKFYPDNARITFEGTRFIWKDTGNPLVDTPVCGRLTSWLPFEDCPNTAQYCITYQAAYDTYVADNGVDSTAQKIQQKLAGFAISLSAEHTRSQNFSAQQKPTVRRWLNNLRG